MEATTLSYFLRRNEQNLWHGKFSTFPDEIVHAVSTRIGGYSKKPFDSLNLGLHVGDNVDDVIINREKFIRSLGYELEDIVTPNQIHGENIFRAEESHRGRGSHNYNDSIPQTDALITNVPNLPLMLCFADCVPILFADTKNRAVGIAHGGWKGTMMKIAAKTFIAMRDNFGTKPEHCLVGIAPSIGACCYEVGDNVIAACREVFPAQVDELIINRDGRSYLDLWAANRIQLVEVGIPSKNIDVARECTCCTDNFYFSYRAARKNNQQETGRIGALIALKGE